MANGDNLADGDEMAIGGTELIAHEGDVILVVNGEAQKNVRVSSATLASISPVFKALFGPNFHKGRQPRDGWNPVKIALPEDKEEAIIALCRLAHLQCADEPIDLTATSLLHLAVAIDKYKCSSPLSLQCSALLLSWLEHNANETSPGGQESLWRVVSAAFRMDCPHAFKIATSRLILTTCGPFSSHFSAMLPTNVIWAVAEKRSSACRKFCTEIPELAIDRCPRGCDNSDALFMQSLAAAYDLLYWPPSFETSLQQLLGPTRWMPCVVRGKQSCPCTYGVVRVTQNEFRLAADRVQKGCGGLCLECARSSSADLSQDCKVHVRRL